MRHDEIVRDVRVAVIGGGMQGITFTAFALHHSIVGPDEICIIDPNGTPLAVLEERFKDCVTEHLRSGLGDHCGCDESSFTAFVERERREGDLRTASKRPTVGLFLDHTRYVVGYHRMVDLTLTARAVWFSLVDGRWHINTNQGIVRAERVHLCLGQSAPFYPDWARALRGHDPRISHIFDRDYELRELPGGEVVAVIGGGITAAQVACSIAESGRKVLLLTRRPLSGGAGEGSDYWKDHETRHRVLCSCAWPERFGVLRKHGDRGTVPPWELERIERLVSAGGIEHFVCNVEALVPTPDGIEVIRRDGSTLRSHVSVLATGMTPELPSWLTGSARAAGLPFDENGRPVLQDNLQWGYNSCVFLHGVHAAPVVGPFAANISGARIAASITMESLSCPTSRS
ncbi:MAG: SidA/IucD/PvdA family monooxygenase [Bdellovibrionales bacterium]|nr:SidA/IucD/PvdA family monooxygenase [Bdellovibrionales bacterium]